MKANKIRTLTRNIQEECSENFNRDVYEVNRISNKIDSLNSEISKSLKIFANIQLIQNALAYGREVENLMSNYEISKKKNSDSILSVREESSVIEKELVNLRNELKSANKTISENLNFDTSYQELKIALDRIVKDKNESSQAFNELIEEVERKLPEYERSSVFQYLLNSKFNTNEYVSRPFISKLDAILARKSFFTENLENFRLLQKIRENASLGIETIESEYRKALDSFELYEMNAYNSLEVLRIKDSIKKLEFEMDASNIELDLHLENEKKYIEFNDSLSNEAKLLIYNFLQDKDVFTLATLAESTSSNEDDIALEVIKSSINEIKDLNTELVIAKDKMRSTEIALNRANELRRTIDYDSRLSSDNYQYSSESRVLDMLNGFVLGSIASSDLIGNLSSQREYVPSEPRYSQTSISSSSFWSDSDDVSRSRSSYSGSDDSGFSTSSSSSSSSDSFSTSDSF